MEQARRMVPARNALVCFGLYYLDGWLTFVFSIFYDKLTNRIIYDGDFGAAVLLPLVLHFPRALFSAIAGFALFYLVESQRPVLWAVLLAATYAGLGFTGYHWARPLMPADRVGQAVGALYPAVTCVLGTLLANRLARKSRLPRV